MAGRTKWEKNVYGLVGGRVGGSRRGFRQSTVALGVALLAVACSLSLPDEEDIDGAVDDVVTDLGSDLGLGGSGSLDPAAILGALFPDLSASEIADITVSLTLDEVMALRDELEAIRVEVAEFSADLFQTAEERVAEREMDLGPEGAFPESLEALGAVCLYDEAQGTATVALSGVFSGQTAIQLETGSVSVLVDGAAQSGSLSCLYQGESVDIVLLVDITGSMSNVIASVRDSVVAFTEAVSASGLVGTLSVVTFQDTVGVDVTFQEPAPPSYERSPFFPPVDMGDADAVDSLQAFVRSLEANRGADAPENLSGAIDFARNSVIGGTEAAPIVIDGDTGPNGTRPFPALTSEHQVFIALTDITFHSDATSSISLLPEFQPRPAGVIARSLHQTGTVVHIVDPSWVDANLDPADPGEDDVDADYWAINSGGLGEDVVLGYSLLDLELVVVAERTGLLDVVLDAVLATSCKFEFSADLSVVTEVEVELAVEGEVYTEVLPVISF